MTNIQHVLVVSGVSGSGKSTAVHVLEDLGFFCMDNVPVSLLHSVMALCANNDEVDKVSLVIDAREGSFLANVGQTLDLIKSKHPLTVLWLDAQNSTLLKRFQMTKRRHPLGTNLPAAISEERNLLSEVLSRATVRIDTSHMNPHELSDEIRRLVSPDQKSDFRVELRSFGFRHGCPIDMDQILDVRFLPNPYWTESLRELTGRDAPVQAFMGECPELRRYLKVLEPFLLTTSQLAQSTGKPYISVGIGCTGGQHRSVYIVERMAQALDAAGVSVSVEHRHLPGDNSTPS